LSFISVIINIVFVNAVVLKEIIDVTHSSSLAKLSVLAIVVIPTIMTISMHGYVLAVGEPGYQLTVKVSSYPFGTSTLGISITTENGYTDHADVATSGVTSWMFNIPANQGSSVRVCVNSDNSSEERCSTYNTTGIDMSVSLSPPSSNSNRYVYPGNTYYIYLGYRHDYDFHHDRDHWFGGHENGRDHWFGGHQDSGNNGVGAYGGHRDTGNNGNGGNQNSGNIGSGNNGNGGNQNSGNNGVGGYGGHRDTGNNGNGGNQNSGNIGSGNNGFGGHQDHWYGGHQDSGNIGNGGNQNSGNNGFGSGNNGLGNNRHQESGNHGVTQPADHSHHLSDGAPMMNAESSDDDSDLS
jgi:hypothetical protein